MSVRLWHEKIEVKALNMKFNDLIASMGGIFNATYIGGIILTVLFARADFMGKILSRLFLVKKHNPNDK
jgi:hypothetical protein